MTETNMSASHFRVHLKEIANSVKAGGQAVTVERHGCQMFAVVSLEDLEFLRKHKYGSAEASPSEATRAEPAPEMINLINPDWMPIEQVEEAYRQSNGSTDESVISWRYRAFLQIKAVRGKPPDQPWFGPSS